MRKRETTLFRNDDFPVFGRLRGLVLGFSLLVPIAASSAAWMLLDAWDLPSWLAGLLLGTFLTAMTAPVFWIMVRRLKPPLEEILSRVRMLSGGDFDGRLDIAPGDEMKSLKQAINEMTAYLVVAEQMRDDHISLQAVIDGIPYSVVVLDGNGVVEFSNARFARLMDQSGQIGVIGRGLETLAGAAIPSWYKILIDKGRLEDESVEWPGRDGDLVSLSLSGTLVRDEEGLPHRTILIARETDNDAGSDVPQSSDLFQNLFDAIEDPITVLGLNGEVLQANRAARATFGSQLLGQKCFRAFRMRDSMCDECPASMTYANRKTATVEHRIFGNAITRIHTYPLLGKNGDVKAIINHKRDVTKERQLEDLKAGFLAAVSHELRTPLTSIIGFNKLNSKRIKRYISPSLDSAPHKVRHVLQQIRDDMDVMVSESERLGRLVNDILDLSKLEAGRMQLELSEVDIAASIQSAAAATASLWRAKGLLIETRLEPELPPVLGDGDRLSQILVNLVSNAIKFTDAGQITVHAKTDASFVQVSIEDSGSGIPPDQLKTVFEKFRQSEQVNSKRTSGTGLGLTICRELVALHQGEIWVESTVGQGTTFHFTVPVASQRSQFGTSVRTRVSFAGEFGPLE